MVFSDEELSYQDILSLSDSKDEERLGSETQHSNDEYSDRDSFQSSISSDFEKDIMPQSQDADDDYTYLETTRYYKCTRNGVVPTKQTSLVVTKKPRGANLRQLSSKIRRARTALCFGSP